MKLNKWLSLMICTASLLVITPAHAQGLRVPGSSSFGNDWRVGSSPGNTSGYGANTGSASTYGAPPDDGAPRQYGGGSPSLGASGSGALPGGGYQDSTASSGSSTGSMRPTQPVAPRSPGGGLRTN